MKRIASLLLFSTLSFSVFCQTSSTTDSLKVEQVVQRIEVLLDSSSAFYFKGNYIKSLETNIEIVELAKSINSSKYLYKGYRFLSYDYLVLNDSISARQNFENAQKYAKLDNDEVALAESYMDLANYYSTTSLDFERALTYHNMSIDKFSSIKDTAGLVKSYYNILVSHNMHERLGETLPFLQEMETLNYRNHKDQSIIPGVLSYWGLYFSSVKEYDSANAHFKEAINFCNENNFPIEQALALDGLANSLYLQGNYKEAYDTRMDFESLDAQNMHKIQSTESQSVSAKFQLEEYRRRNMEMELENELKAAEAKNHKAISSILIMVSFIGLLFFIGLYFAYRKRKQLVELLRTKNKQYLEAKFKSEHLAKAKSRFFSTVSHELRTPLYGVIGLSTILLEDESLSKHKKDLKSLKFSADYLLALINDVLHINKIDSERHLEGKSSFNLRETVESIVSSVEYMRIQHNNEIHVNISEDIPQLVKGNPVSTAQILMNLLGNSCKFTENGHIYVDLSLKLSSSEMITVHFSVRDTGIGIAKEKQKAIFEEFAQAESLNYNYEGTGLGLPIVKKLLNLAGSEIYVTSELGEGSEFSFGLTFEIDTTEEKVEDVNVLDVGRLNGRKILIVEDNRINQIVTQKILEKKGLICTIAENGKEAISHAENTDFDLILMDLNMPVMNGLEACIAIRKFNASVPIIALTAVEVDEVRKEIKSAGMNDIIIKPYDVAAFVQTLLRNMQEVKMNLMT